MFIIAKGYSIYKAVLYIVSLIITLWGYCFCMLDKYRDRRIMAKSYIGKLAMKI